MNRKPYLCTLVIVGFSLFLTAIILCFSAAAHSGGTDSKGGHYDHSTGDYHYHHGYSAHEHPNGKCPYDFDDNTEGTSSFGDIDKTLLSKTLINVIIILGFSFVLFALVLLFAFSQKQTNSQLDNISKAKAPFIRVIMKPLATIETLDDLLTLKELFLTTRHQAFENFEQLKSSAADRLTKLKNSFYISSSIVSLAAVVMILIIEMSSWSKLLFILGFLALVVSSSLFVYYRHKKKGLDEISKHKKQVLSELSIFFQKHIKTISVDKIREICEIPQHISLSNGLPQGDDFEKFMSYNGKVFHSNPDCRGQLYGKKSVNIFSYIRGIKADELDFAYSGCSFCCGTLVVPNWYKRYYELKSALKTFDLSPPDNI